MVVKRAKVMTVDVALGWKCETVVQSLFSKRAGIQGIYSMHCHVG